MLPSTIEVTNHHKLGWPMTKSHCAACR